MQACSITDEQMLTQYMGQHYLGKIVVVLCFYSAHDDGGAIYRWLREKLPAQVADDIAAEANQNVFIVCDDIDEARELASSAENADVWVNQVWADSEL